MAIFKKVEFSWLGNKWLALSDLEGAELRATVIDLGDEAMKQRMSATQVSKNFNEEQSAGP